MRAIQKIFATAFVSAAIGAMLIPASASAFSAGGVGGGGFGGGVGGGFGSGMGPVGGVPMIAGGVGVSPNNLTIQNLPGPQQMFRQLDLAGRIPTDPSKAAAGTRIVRLSVNGEIVPMALDTETASANVQFEPDSDYARQLYKAIFDQPVTVVGDERLRSEIMEAASDTSNTRIVKINGYVFDRLSPYMVVKSVEDAN